MDVLTSILQDPKTGVSVVLGIMWWMERKRADRLEQERAALLERVLTGLLTATVAISGATASIDSIKTSIATFIETARRQ